MQRYMMMCTCGNKPFDGSIDYTYHEVNNEGAYVLYDDALAEIEKARQEGYECGFRVGLIEPRETDERERFYALPNEAPATIMHDVKEQCYCHYLDSAKAVIKRLEARLAELKRELKSIKACGREE